MSSAARRHAALSDSTVPVAPMSVTPPPATSSDCFLVSPVGTVPPSAPSRAYTPRVLYRPQRTPCSNIRHLWSSLQGSLRLQPTLRLLLLQLYGGLRLCPTLRSLCPPQVSHRPLRPAGLILWWPPLVSYRLQRLPTPGPLWTASVPPFKPLSARLREVSTSVIRPPKPSCAYPFVAPRAL